MPTISISDIPKPILNAIGNASKQTGVGFDYLLKTAQRESNFDHQAKARTTSARGLFQFIDNTWLELVKEEGKKFGLNRYSDAITKDPNGRYSVHNPSLKTEILDLRNKPEIAATMAGLLAQKNASSIQHLTGQKPSQGELYAAHFLGPRDAARLIQLNRNAPDDTASAHFLSAARHNQNIFIDGSRHKSIAEVYQVLTMETMSFVGDLRKIGSENASWPATVQSSGTTLNMARNEAGNKSTPLSPGSIGVWGSIAGPVQEFVEQNEFLKKNDDPNRAGRSLASIPLGPARVQMPNEEFSFMRGLVSDKAGEKK